MTVPPDAVPPDDPCPYCADPEPSEVLDRADPLSVDCPYCGSPAGELCRVTAPVVRPHASRKLAAAMAADS